MDRRSFITAAAIAPLAGSVGAGALAPDDGQSSQHQEMVAVIEALEAWQGWGNSSVSAAKAFAAFKMRMALGLPLPDPESAQQHIDRQRSTFDSYKATYWYERDIAAGKNYHLSAFETALEAA